MHHSVRTPFITELSRDIDARAWRSVVVTLAPPGPLNEEVEALGIKTVSLQAGTRWDYAGAATRLAAILRAQRADILHSHLFEANLVAALVRRLGQVRALAITRHEPPGFMELAGVSSIKRAAVRRLATVAASAADVIVAPSRLTETELVADGVRVSKIRRIPVGIDLTKFRLAPDEIAARRVELGLQAKFSAAVVGRLATEKNTEAVIRAWTHVVASRPDAVLLVIGRGPLEHRLHDLAAELGIYDRIRFLGYRPDVVSCIAAADLVVHASRTESTGAVLLEALALGKPLVTTAVGVVGEHLVDGEHCLVVRDHPAEMAAGMLAVANDPELSARLGASGRRLVHDVFSMPAMARAYERLWGSLL